MTRWPAADLPILPSPGDAAPALHLHDAVTGGLVPAVPAGAEHGRMYVCGITPYDATHLGHAATYVAFDLVNRFWRDAGLEVTYVQNVTDVDDPLLERAAATGVDWHALATEQTQLFADDMAALRVLPPEHYHGVIDSLPLVVEAVERLMAAGAAYRVPGEYPDVYFDLAADPRFGQVSGLDDATMAALFAERGGDPERAGKRSPLDPLLWRVARPDEPEWDGASLGRGRPGWHIECTTIALRHLGMGFDVQGGGSDLIFPHHEMGAAHAHALTGEHPFARVFAHAGMVGYQGHKMSKSRGNLVLVSRLRHAGTDPMAIRLALLAHHYRSDWEWTDADLDAASTRLARWREATRRPVGPDAAELLGAVRGRLAADLDAPGALAVMDAWADAALAGTGGDSDAPAGAGRAVEALLGVRLAT